ncbi:MAG: PIN domain-containing protein [Armatimonadota bacterium]|nr:PIN domain-containing protein [Armatimonadota bacterium]
MSWLIDTNVLVRLRDADSPHHLLCVQAIQALRSQREELCVCTQVAIEYYVVATRPREVNGIGLRTEEALQDVRDLKALFHWLPEPPDIDRTWQHIVAKYAITGKQAHDARLLALMVSHHVENLLTLNVPHFRRFEEISVVSPHELGSNAE